VQTIEKSVGKTCFPGLFEGVCSKKAGNNPTGEDFLSFFRREITSIDKSNVNEKSKKVLKAKDTSQRFSCKNESVPENLQNEEKQLSKTNKSSVEAEGKVLEKESKAAKTEVLSQNKKKETLQDFEEDEILPAGEMAYFPQELLASIINTLKAFEGIDAEEFDKLLNNAVETALKEIPGLDTGFAKADELMEFIKSYVKERVDTIPEHSFIKPENFTIDAAMNLKNAVYEEKAFAIEFLQNEEAEIPSDVPADILGEKPETFDAAKEHENTDLIGLEVQKTGEFSEKVILSAQKVPGMKVENKDRDMEITEDDLLFEKPVFSMFKEDLPKVEKETKKDGSFFEFLKDDDILAKKGVVAEENIEGDNSISFSEVVLKTEIQPAEVALNHDNAVKKEEFILQIVEKAKVLLDGDKQEIVMDLKPDYLGKMTLKVVTERGIVAAQFVAENEQVKSILESNMQLLKDALQKQGFNVQECSVSVGQGRDGESGKHDAEERKLFGRIGTHAVKSNFDFGYSMDAIAALSMGYEDYTGSRINLTV